MPRYSIYHTRKSQEVDAGVVRVTMALQWDILKEKSTGDAGKTASLDIRIH